MIDANELEIQGFVRASEQAGEYIESLKRTDLSQWTQEEWNVFIETVIQSYVTEICRLKEIAWRAADRVALE